MAVEDPGELQVTCDECGAEMQMATTSYCGSPNTFGVDEATLQEHGWTSEGDSTFCPKCSEEKANEEDE